MILYLLFSLSPLLFQRSFSHQYSFNVASFHKLSVLRSLILVYKTSVSCSLTIYIFFINEKKSTIICPLTLHTLVTFCLFSVFFLCFCFLFLFLCFFFLFFYPRCTIFHILIVTCVKIIFHTLRMCSIGKLWIMF